MRPIQHAASLVLSLALGLSTAGCGVTAMDDGELDAEETVGADESALYQGWAKAPRELVHLGHWAPPVCGNGHVQASEACDDGNHTDGDGCSKSCAIESGFACSGSPSACADVDECAAPTAVCGSSATCQNLPGTFSCACKPGFVGDGITCADVDECAQGSDACGAHSVCFNQPGDYACLCDPGFADDGAACVDIDECATNPCHGAATCENHEGGFKCACPSGYEDSDGDCADVDECANGTAACAEKASCTNVLGGYRCECPEGSAGDGFRCE